MPSTKWDIVVVGSINTDYTARSKKLPGPGDSLQGERFEIGQGGKGANQAVAAARLGARVAMVGCIGKDDRGDAAVENFQAEGVDTSSLIRDDEQPTGAALVQVDKSGQKQIVSIPHANGALTVEDVQAADVIHQTKVILCQLEIPLEVVQAAIKIGAEAGAKVILDPAPAQELPDDLLRQVTVIKPNAGEAQTLTGIEVTDQESARDAAKALLARGVNAVAIQAGEEGNLLIWDGGEVWLPKFDVESVDATGAGDAFAAGLAVCLAEETSWEEAGWIANAAAALTTTQFGAQSALPRRGAVEELLSKQKNH